MTKVAILGGATALFTLAALALTSYHTEMRCHTEVGDVSTNECPEDFEDKCPDLYAYGFKLIITSGSTEADANYLCPWRKPTAILGLIGLSLTQIFLGLLFATVKGKALKIPMVALAGLIIPVLLSAFGLMIRDLKRGYDSHDAAEAAGTDVHHRPGTYLANIILLFFGVCMIGGAAFLGFNADADGASAKAPSANTKSGASSSNSQNTQFQQLNNQSPTKTQDNHHHHHHEVENRA